MMDSMQTVLIVIHLMVVLALIGVVLIQRSEGGGLGIGGGGGGTGGFFSARGSANVLTRATAILALLFFLTSLALTIVAGWIVGHEDGHARLAVVLPVMLAFAFTSNLAYAAMGALLRRWLAQGRRLLWFNRAMACVLVATALWMVAA